MLRWLEPLLRGWGTPELLPVVMLLCVWGLVSLFSASAGLGSEPGAVQAGLLLRQAMGLAAGCAVAALLVLAPPQLLRTLGPWVWLASALALWATQSPLGVVRNDARRWLDLGLVTIQPLEFAKLGLVLGLASWFARFSERTQDVRFAVVVPAIAIAVLAAGAIVQPDFGGAVLLVLFGAGMMFVAGARTGHLALCAGLALPPLVIIGLDAPYRVDRLAVFWDPWVDAQRAGYQLVQSLLAFGGGGVFGAGLGASHQKWSYLPEAHTDFILSVLAEELGLVGVGALLACFTILAFASLGIAARARDLHGQLLAAGAGMLLWVQAAINAGVAMGRLPTTGTTLPLFSYGRSSMIVSLAALGLILHVARPRTADREGWR